MKNLLKNKFLIIVLILSVLIVGTSCFISLLGYSSYIRNAFGFVISPFQELAVSINEKIDSVYKRQSDYDELKAKNEELEKELREANEKLHEASLDTDENEWLKGYLGIKDEHNDYTFCDAKVIGRDDGILTLNKGSFHGIEPGMAVINENGIAGKITEVGSNYSKMAVVTHSSFSAGIIVEERAENGVISGDFSLYEKGLSLVSYLPVNTQIAAGDRIITSGLGSTLPDGLAIGEVTEVYKDEFQREVKAYVKPYVSPDSINKVMIITKYEKKLG